MADNTGQQRDNLSTSPKIVTLCDPSYRYCKNSQVVANSWRYKEKKEKKILVLQKIGLYSSNSNRDVYRKTAGQSASWRIRISNLYTVLTCRGLNLFAFLLRYVQMAHHKSYCIIDNYHSHRHTSIQWSQWFVAMLPDGVWSLLGKPAFEWALTEHYGWWYTNKMLLKVYFPALSNSSPTTTTASLSLQFELKILII